MNDPRMRNRLFMAYRDDLRHAGRNLFRYALRPARSAEFSVEMLLRNARNISSSTAPSGRCRG